ncbi:hypothetical protein HEP73_02123 [Xanthomonas sp. GW]|uniref:hypothetical protein n=1 Tax=Xanthomonas sp. GW TaxID=2724121 RepID=UPI00163AF475|nr:hypothetical protein [Xanthomonas sp. GW]QNH21211.1 hypothetical protein HEP73_02123 [Xanthomonas sp. GW]
MKALTLLRLLLCGAAVSFLGDMLRRCFVVEAWTLVPFVAAALVLALIATRWSWRAARRTWAPADPAAPDAIAPEFPAQPKRDIR